MAGLSNLSFSVEVVTSGTDTSFPIFDAMATLSDKSFPVGGFDVVVGLSNLSFSVEVMTSFDVVAR